MIFRFPFIVGSLPFGHCPCWMQWRYFHFLQKDYFFLFICLCVVRLDLFWNFVLFRLIYRLWIGLFSLLLFSLWFFVFYCLRFTYLYLVENQQTSGIGLVLFVGNRFGFSFNSNIFFCQWFDNIFFWILNKTKMIGFGFLLILINRIEGKLLCVNRCFFFLFVLHDMAWYVDYSWSNRCKQISTTIERRKRVCVCVCAFVRKRRNRKKKRE